MSSLLSSYFPTLGAYLFLLFFLLTCLRFSAPPPPPPPLLFLSLFFFFPILSLSFKYRAQISFSSNTRDFFSLSRLNALYSNIHFVTFDYVQGIKQNKLASFKVYLNSGQQTFPSYYLLCLVLHLDLKPKPLTKDIVTIRSFYF